MPVPWGLFSLLSMRDGVIDTVTEQQQDMPLWSSCDVNKSQGLYGGVSFRQADAEYIRGGSVLSLSLSLHSFSGFFCHESPCSWSIDSSRVI